MGMEPHRWNTTNSWYIADWIWHILTVEDLRSIRIVPIGIWIIWHNRNLMVHGKTSMSTEACHFKAMRFLSQYESRNLVCNGLLQNNNSDIIYFYSDGSRSAKTKKWRVVVYCGKG